MRPLEVDVGVPFLGCHVAHKVVDGNHRLASGVYRQERLGQDALLPLSVAGDVEYAHSLGLWTSRRGLPRRPRALHQPVRLSEPARAETDH